MSLLLMIALLAPATQAQETFEDPVFDFTLPVPEGMVLLTPAEYAKQLGVTEEEVTPKNREDVPDGRVAHHFRFVDTTPAKRLIQIQLEDNPPPWIKPEVFVEAITSEMNMTVARDDSIEGDLKPCMYLEGTRTISSGEVLNSIVAYLPGQARYGLIVFSAPAANWDQHLEPFLATLESCTFERPVEDVPASSPMSEARLAAGVGGALPESAQPVATGSQDDWLSLQVTGSLVLAGLLVLSLFFRGGRAPA